MNLLKASAQYRKPTLFLTLALCAATLAPAHQASAQRRTAPAKPAATRVTRDANASGLDARPRLGRTAGPQRGTAPKAQKSQSPGAQGAGTALAHASSSKGKKTSLATHIFRRVLASALFGSTAAGTGALGVMTYQVFDHAISTQDPALAAVGVGAAVGTALFGRLSYIMGGITKLLFEQGRAPADAPSAPAT